MEWFIVLFLFKFVFEVFWRKKVVMNIENELLKNILIIWNGNLYLFIDDLKIFYF